MLSSHLLVLRNGCFSRYVSFIHQGLTSVYIYLTSAVSLCIQVDYLICFSLTDMNFLHFCHISGRPQCHSEAADIFQANKKLNILVLVYSSHRLRWSRGSVLAFGTQVRGFKPGRSLRIFKGEKILSTLSFGGICGM
jgi:hypothetical protein